MSVDIPVFAKLLGWYDAHARDLPWRSPPGTPSPDPYRVWLSEVMLQQTTVASVKPYFLRFTERWPTVEALARADDADVMTAWAGLGYYSRARSLIACARAVAALGAFPDTEAGLLALPGIGRYTAAAIAAIAFGRQAVVVDGNVERVVARLFAVEVAVPAARSELRRLTETLTPDARSGDFAQAMMDVGATICSPRNPRCLLCPLAADCRARATGDPARYPLRAAKLAKPERTATCWWIERDGTVWLVRRPAKGLLGSMRALPSDLGDTRASTALVEGKARVLGAIRHVFTHFTLTMTIVATAGEPGCNPPPGGEWWRIEDLDSAGLPTVFSKAAAVAIGVK